MLPVPFGTTHFAMNTTTSPFDLALETLRTTLASNPRPPVVYYILSAALPVQNDQVVRIANDGAALVPYDLVCHPDQLVALQQALAGIAELRLHTNPHWRHCIEQMVAWWGQTVAAAPH
jgi:hypothetical protein